MYLSRGFPKTISWLLAAAIAVQPVSGFSCGCNAARADAAKRPARQRCCCGCCCGLAHRGEMSNTPHRDHALIGRCTCHCGSGAPATPQSTPAQRTHSDDLAAPVLYAYAVTIDSPTVHQGDWAFSLLTHWASASEHCIALCQTAILIPSL